MGPQLSIDERAALEIKMLRLTVGAIKLYKMRNSYTKGSLEFHDIGQKIKEKGCEG